MNFQPCLTFSLRISFSGEQASPQACRAQAGQAGGLAPGNTVTTHRPRRGRLSTWPCTGLSQEAACPHTTGPWCAERQRVGACRAGVMPELRPGGQGGGQGTGWPHASVEHGTPRGLAPHVPLDPALLQAQAPRQDVLADSLGTPPGAQGIHPACSLVLETTEEAARRSGPPEGLRARGHHQPAPGEQNQAGERELEGGARVGAYASGWPHALGRARQGAWPCPTAAQDHMPDPEGGAGRCRHRAGSEMGWPWGLRGWPGPPCRDWKPLQGQLQVSAQGSCLTQALPGSCLSQTLCWGGGPATPSPVQLNGLQHCGSWRLGPPA